MAKELNISTRNYGVRYTMKLDHVFKEKPSNVACMIHFVAGYKVCHFAKTIYHHKNGIKTTLCSWES